MSGTRYLTGPESKLKYRHFQPELYRGPKENLFVRPFAHQVKGDLRIGYVNGMSHVFGLTLDEFSRPTLIVGITGSGKTTIMRNIQIELYRLTIPFLVFELSKFGSRYIKHYIPKLVILRWNNEFFFNPLKPPPGVRLKEWMLTFCEVTSEIFGLLAASKSQLIDLVQSLYKKFDSENKGIHPTIHDLHRALDVKRKSTRSRVDIDYIDRVKNKINAICITLGDVLDVEEGIPIDELLKYPVSIELVGINSSEIQAWIASLIMAWIASYRTANAHFGELRHAIFYDEAAHAFGKQSYSSKESFLISCIRRLRESGEAMVLADQSIASLNDVFKE